MAVFSANCCSEFILRDVIQSRVFLQTATDNLGPNYRTGGRFGGGRVEALQSAGNPPRPEESTHTFQQQQQRWRRFLVTRRESLRCKR